MLNTNFPNSLVYPSKFLNKYTWYENVLSKYQILYWVFEQQTQTVLMPITDYVVKC